MHLLEIDVKDGKGTIVVEIHDMDEDARLRSFINEAEAAFDRLRDIGDYAHEHSTGPAVPDALWAVREMAYELV